jgi:hypothetical protein
MLEGDEWKVVEFAGDAAFAEELLDVTGGVVRGPGIADHPGRYYGRCRDKAPVDIRSLVLDDHVEAQAACR